MSSLLLLLVLVALVGCAMAPTTRTDEVPPDVLRAMVRAPTGQVSYLRKGERTGPRMVFVHGTPGSAEGWLDFVAEPVVAGWEMLAVDRPGFGRSDPRDAVTSLAEQADALVPLLEARGGRRAVLVGHSLGGPIVLRAAIDHPELVGAVVVLSGNADPALEDVAWYNAVAAVLEPVLPRALRNSNRELYPHREELEVLADGLGGVRCPVLIVHGAKDTLVPIANAYWLRDALRAAPTTFVVLKDHGHLLPWRAEDEVRAAIAEFVRGVQ